MKVSQGQRMDQEKAVSRGASDSAVDAPALLDSSWTAQCPPGLPVHQAWGGESVVKPRLGVGMEERGRAKTSVWKGMGAAAAVFLLTTCIPTADSLGKNLLLGSGLCLARPPIRGSWYQ